MISKKYLVSIVIPVYNSEKFISEAIESVLNQSLRDIEIIIVDDGSTDNSLLICEHFLQKDSRIQLLKQKNSGVSIARNNGLELVTGEYVFFMDSDDTIDSEFIKSSYEKAKKLNLDIVVIGEHCCLRLPNVSALPTWGQLLRHDFLLKYSDIRFPENIQPCEDGLFSHQLLALTTSIGTNSHGIYHYREHENQNHKTNNEIVEKILIQIPKWFQVLEDFYKKYNLYESHSLHLALFMEHELFQFRYLSMSLNTTQKSALYVLINEFIQKNVMPFLKNAEREKLSDSFLFFIKYSGISKFDNFCKMLDLKYKIKLILLNIIPISKARKRIRKKIIEERKKNILK